MKMQIALQMNKTSLQTTYNMTSQLTYNMTSQLNNPQKNGQNEESQLISDWKNNRPLVILTFCLLIIILCTVLSWYIDTYLPRKNNSHEILVNEEIENVESSDNKTCSKSFRVTIAPSQSD